MATKQALDPQQQATINALAAGWQTIPASKQDAANSLLAWYASKGFLTTKQWDFAHSLAKWVKPVQAPPDAAKEAFVKAYGGTPPDEIMGVPDFTIGMEPVLAEIEKIRASIVGEKLALTKPPYDAPGAPKPAKVLNDHGDLVPDPLGTQLFQSNTGALDALKKAFVEQVQENSDPPGEDDLVHADSSFKLMQKLDAALVAAKKEQVKEWHKAVADKYDLEAEAAMSSSVECEEPKAKYTVTPPSVGAKYMGLEYVHGKWEIKPTPFNNVLKKPVFNFVNKALKKN